MEVSRGSDYGPPAIDMARPQTDQPKQVQLMTAVKAPTSGPPPFLQGQPGSRSQPPVHTWAVPQIRQPYAVERRGTFNTDSRPQHFDRPGPPRTLQASPQIMRSFGVQRYPPSLQILQQQQQQSALGISSWSPKACHDFDGVLYETDMTELSSGILGAHEDAPIIDLRNYSTLDRESMHSSSHRDSLASSRRMSESTHSMSSNGPSTEHTLVDDHMPAGVTLPIEYEWPQPTVQTHPLPSPLPSPSLHQHEMARSGSRSRASPNQYNNARAAPYTLDTNRAKRWSTGNYTATTPTRSAHPVSHRYSFYGSPLNPNHAFTGSHADLQPINFPSHAQGLVFSPTSCHIPKSAVLPSSEQFFPEVARPLPSQGFFRMLQSNSERHSGCGSHFSDLAGPPDLYGSLHNQPSDPPESDMNPSDPELIPHEQDLRFAGDLYTPRWVRGHGNKREGWCGLCKPGRWLVLKNSAFWYDKSFTHGVSAATGAAFQGPRETRRTEGNLDVWEGLCTSCDDWVPLVSSKKKGTTWFRHAYKCHTHAKAKDGSKKRRDTGGSSRPTSTTNTESLSQPSASSAAVGQTDAPLDAPSIACCSEDPVRHGTTNVSPRTDQFFSAKTNYANPLPTPTLQTEAFQHHTFGATDASPAGNVQLTSPSFPQKSPVFSLPAGENSSLLDARTGPANHTNAGMAHPSPTSMQQSPSQFDDSNDDLERSVKVEHANDPPVSQDSMHNFLAASEGMSFMFDLGPNDFGPPSAQDFGQGTSASYFPIFDVTSHDVLYSYSTMY